MASSSRRPSRANSAASPLLLAPSPASPRASAPDAGARRAPPPPRARAPALRPRPRAVDGEEPRGPHLRAPRRSTSLPLRSAGLQQKPRTELELGPMAESSRPPEQLCGSLTIANLPKDILSNIPLLLPPKSILRCRAVCKAWCAVTSDRDFLLAHHRRQPPRRLLTFIRDVDHGWEFDNKIEVVDYCVEAVDLRSHEFLSVARFLGTDYPDSNWERSLEVHAACNGLLLMSYNNCLHLCNPTTRQWSWVSPPTLPHDKVAGLYHAHGHPSEYRVLYYRATGLEPTFYVSTVSSGKERCISPHSWSTSLRAWLAEGLEITIFHEPFLFHGNLHWLPFLDEENIMTQENIVMFNTVDEVFQWLPLPFTRFAAASLLEIEGKLSISTRHDQSSVDLWGVFSWGEREKGFFGEACSVRGMNSKDEKDFFWNAYSVRRMNRKVKSTFGTKQGRLLQDYEHVVWVHKFRIELPLIEMIGRFGEMHWWCPPNIVSEEGDVWINAGCWQLHYDRKGNLMEQFKCDGRFVEFTSHILRESLVPDAVFQNSDNDRRHAPHFFRGL